MAKKFDIEEVKKSIIKSLHKNRYYNKRHTPIKNVCKRLPKIPCKYIKKAIKELKNENIIKIKPTYHDADIYLNVKSVGRNYLILNIFHFLLFHENFFNLML